MEQTNIALILAIVALAIALISFGIAFYLLWVRMKKRASGPSKEAAEALSLAQDLDTGFEKRCRKIAGKMIKDELDSLMKAAPVQEKKTPEVKVEEKPAKPVFVSQKFYGEFSDIDNGFFVEDMTPGRVARSQVVIETLTEDTAEFSIIPDVDKTLVSGIKECCKVEKGDWMEFNVIRTAAKGTIRLNGDIWNVIDKAAVILE